MPGGDDAVKRSGSGLEQAHNANNQVSRDI